MELPARNKTLMYAGVGGAGLALVYLASRGGGSGAQSPSQAIGNSSSELESLYRSVTSGYDAAIGDLAKTLRGETTEQIKGLREEEAEARKTAKEEQKGFLDALAAALRGELKTESERIAGEQKGLREALGTTLRAETKKAITTSETKQAGVFSAFEKRQAGVFSALKAELLKTVTALTQRITGLESTTKTLQKVSSEQAKELTEQAKLIEGQKGSWEKAIQSAVSAEEAARKKQAQLIADTSRIGYARAAGFSNLMRFGTSIQQAEVDKTIAAIAREYDLTETEREAVRTWLQGIANSLQRGEYGGSGGLSFLSPLLPGPMGFTFHSAVGGTSVVKGPELRADLATPTWGVH